ncbi:uncharacterized protein DS421_13g412040 [Arachis hypogaea]|nr:uncharacterized protein DS421_13g412040 [Arachis hypogaea]
MWRTLKSKNKHKFIDQSILKPELHDSMFEAWDHCNTHVISWIHLSLSLDISQSVMWHNNAIDLWQDLKHLYYQGDIFQIAEIEEELFSMRQGALFITEYFTMLKAVWEELQNFRPVPPCVSCTTSCICGLETTQGYLKDTYVVRFLRGRNEQFPAVRSQLMLLKPLPDIDLPSFGFCSKKGNFILLSL